MKTIHSRHTGSGRTTQSPRRGLSPLVRPQKLLRICKLLHRICLTGVWDLTTVSSSLHCDVPDCGLHFSVPNLSVFFSWNSSCSPLTSKRAYSHSITPNRIQTATSALVSAQVCGKEPLLYREARRPPSRSPNFSCTHRFLTPTALGPGHRKLPRLPVRQFWVKVGVPERLVSHLGVVTLVRVYATKPVFDNKQWTGSSSFGFRSSFL
jgi:hypothetical protein